MMYKNLCIPQFAYRSYSTFSKLKNMEKITKYINGPMGSKFEENLKQQWINFHMSSCDYGFFALFNNNPGFSSKNLLHNLHEIKHLCNSQMPIGFLINNTSSLGKANIEGPVLQSLLFTSPINSQHLYFQWLRQRKIWWSRVINRLLYSTCVLFFVTNLLFLSNAKYECAYVV